MIIDSDLADEYCSMCYKDCFCDIAYSGIVCSRMINLYGFNLEEYKKKREESK